jgi:TPR repeat protein
MEPLDTIYLNAREIADPGKRAAYLSQVCGSDADSRQRLEAMLRDADAAEEYFGSAQNVPDGATALMTEAPGTVIGRYKLLQKIGEGGMGVVYMAEQREPVVRKVALKIIKAGMDTRQVVARFEAERQALALMDHPNIAKVLDGGVTETARPYFVMDLVQGLPITQFCDEAKLSTRERLDLFLEVCSAIQHAHQKGIIHRDIKPTNILVTLHGDKPVPKVIDFGIAKATQQRLTDKTLFTQFQHFIGTPAYMSPEQASLSGLDIDTRSDIYALGVLLYELLTGKTPFDGKELLASGLDEMRRTIREKEPPRPSTRLRTLTNEELTTTAKHRRVEAPRLVSALRGDLDWIVMKCLEKDRTRRYETANGLASDIQRHLRNEPVVARPPSAGYRLQKLAQRNKAAFAAAGAVSGALLFGLGLATWLYVKEKAARQRAVGAERKAEMQAARSTEVARFMKDMLAGVGPSMALGRDTAMLREILDKTAARISKDLTNQPEAEIELRTTLAETYRDLACFREAEGMARQAVQLARAHYSDEHLGTARALRVLGLASANLGDRAQAETLLRQGLAMQKRLLPQDHPEIAESLDRLAHFLYHHQDRCAEAERMQREAIAMKRRLFGNDDRTLPRSLNTLGEVLRDSRGPGRDLREAEALFREALALSERLVGKQDPEGAWALDHLAYLLREDGRLEEAEAAVREALARQSQVLGEDHPDLVWALRNLAQLLEFEGKRAEAEALHRRELAIARKVWGDRHQKVMEAIGHLQAFFETETNIIGLTEVVVMYRKAAEQGDTEAQLQLGAMYQRGKGFAKNSIEAAKWFRLAAEAGNKHAQSWLGGMYWQGEGVVKDLVIARKWYRQAAEAGITAARHELGKMHASGEGGPRDLAEAARLYRQAAVERYAPAEFQLGRAYARGEGVAKDPIEAAKWFRKAAEQTNALAQASLARAYATGRGVSQDKAEAIKWYSKALAQFRKEAERGESWPLNEVAWLLATTDIPEIRDGRTAIQYAERAVAATSRMDASLLDTLAAAYAEDGQFDKAVSIQKEALALVQDEKLRNEFAERLKLFEVKTPYRARD